jgi:hypothetical protein
MAIAKKESPLRSPLLSAFNNIVSINRSTSQMKSTQTSYNEFLRFMTVEVKNLEAIKLPDEKQVKKLSNLNVTSTFGSAGSLLSSLASGALDVGGLIGNFFGGKGKNPKAGKAIPKGTKIKIPGIRGLPIISAALAGLDFAEGISQGESVGKAGAGALGSAAGAAGGALAGAALAGAIGQVLVPIPGLGFVLGAGVGALGGMAGGYLADRAYESATGEGKVKEKTKEKLKQQEQQQKLAAATSLTAVTFPQVLDKFDTVVTQFERTVANLDLSSGPETTMGDASGEQYGESIDPNATKNQSNLPSGEDVTLDGEGTFIQGSTGKSTGPHFHIGPTELYDPKGDKWVGKTTEQGKKDAREAGFKVAKSLMQRKKYFRFTNAGIDVNPGSKLDDDTLMKYVEREQAAHASRSGGGSWGGLDIAGAPGLRMPLPVGDVVSSVHGYGNAARIMGTNAFVGHGMSGSKKTADANIKRSVAPPTAAQENFTPASQQARATSQSKPIPTSAPKPTQDLSQMSTNQLKGMLDPTKTGASNPATFKAAQEARTKGQESGLSGETLEREVMMATIRAKNAESQVVAMSQQPVVPQQLQQYPDYNLPQSSITLIPMMMGGGGGSQQRPMVVSSGGGGGGMTIMPPVPEGQVLNSLFKTILLTNLSGT